MMNEEQKKHISKFLSLVLRHKPETIDVVLDDNGYVSILDLISQINKKGIFKYQMTNEILDEVVTTNLKQRFAYDITNTKIRANQGHSIVDLDLKYEALEPPDTLYHGTPIDVVPVIKEHGIKKMTRHHVHLSKDIDTAIKVGSRRGKPYILKVDSKRMHQDGILFYCSENGVWLTDFVDPKYIN